MAIQLDHLVVVAASLRAGAQFVEAALGVAPGPGRKHAHMGTHNLLLSLGPTVYLEVAAVDPAAAPVARPRWFGLDRDTSRPRLAAWVAASDAIAAAAARPGLGTVETMQREGQSWQMTVTPDGAPPLQGAAPVLIQRASRLHPAAALPDAGLRLRALHIVHPDPAALRVLFADLGLPARPRVLVAHGTGCSLAAEIETPRGPHWLGEPGPAHPPAAA